jgi:hypothetical protein
MNRRPLGRIALATAAAALVLLIVASAASASELKLKCGGKGPRNADSAGTVLCAAAPGKARIISGTVGDDSGKPVAARILITFISWTPAGEGAFT